MAREGLDRSTVDIRLGAFQINKPFLTDRRCAWSSSLGNRALVHIRCNTFSALREIFPHRSASKL